MNPFRMLIKIGNPCRAARLGLWPAMVWMMLLVGSVVGQNDEFPPNMLGPTDSVSHPDETNSAPVTQHTVTLPGPQGEHRVSHLPRHAEKSFHQLSAQVAAGLPSNHEEKENVSKDDPLDNKIDESPIEGPQASGLNSLINLGKSRSAIKVIGGLCVVVAIFFAFTLIARKGGARVNSRIPLEIVEPIGQMALDTKRQLQLIRFGNKILLVCASEKQVHTLAEIDEPSEVEQIINLLHSGQSAQAFGNFRRLTSQRRQQKKTRWMYPSPLAVESEEQDPRLRVESHNVFEA